MSPRPLALIAALAATAGCTYDWQGEHVAAPDACGAADIQGLIGYPVDAVYLPAHVDRVLPYGQTVYSGPTSDGTTLNVWVDGYGIVRRIFCS